MHYDTLLLDADETLMDFPAAERQALQRTFMQHGMHFTDQTDAAYQQINQQLWRQFERGEITRPQLLATRFAALFAQLRVSGIDTDAFNREYLFNLGYGTQLMPHALPVCQTLYHRGYRLYILTNGVSAPQRRRIGGSGLQPYLSGIFVSEESGYQKPLREFYDYVFAQIPNFHPETALMVGDSLSSDMEGARRAGVDACWLNQKGQSAPQDLLFPAGPIRYEIHSLPELLEILPPCNKR